MKKLKISLCFIFTILFVFSLCSCHRVNENTDDTPVSGTQEGETDGFASEESTTSGTVTLTFPEGFTVMDIAEKLEANNVCSAEDFLKEVNNKDYIEEFNLGLKDADNRYYMLEGYLFPDTYEFYIGESAPSVIKRFLRNFNARITDEIRSRAKELGFTVDEIITLASVIQKECGNGRDDNKVSSVLHNRLNSSSFKRLQCDATTSYLRKYVKPYVTEEGYLEYVYRYSTYDINGLPLGAINNPGMACIEAALYPDSTDYYYFVTDSNGIFYFSESWEQHVENCTRAGIY